MKRGGDQGEGKRGGVEGAWEMVGFGGRRGGGKFFGFGGLLFGLRCAIIVRFLPRGVSLAARGLGGLAFARGCPFAFIVMDGRTAPGGVAGFVVSLVVVEGERAGTDRTNGTACACTSPICTNLRSLRFTAPCEPLWALSPQPFPGDR